MRSEKPDLLPGSAFGKVVGREYICGENLPLISFMVLGDVPRRKGENRELAYSQT